MFNDYTKILKPKKQDNKKTHFFNQTCYKEKISLPDEKPDIYDVISIIVDPVIISTRIVNTAKGTSQEGQILLGKKVNIEIKINQKIMYTSTDQNHSVHVVENQYYCSSYIVVPELILGSDPEDLIRAKYLTPEIKVENVFTQKLDNRTIAKNLILYVELRVSPTYLLCFSQDLNCTNSSLYLLYQDGIKIKELCQFKNLKISNPKWSPCGQKIAFICYNHREKLLCYLNLIDSKVFSLIDTETFNNITGFAWGNDGRTILFTAAIKTKKDIFIIDLSNFQWKKLTHSNNKYNNYKPKVSYKFNKIAYLKSAGDTTDLYTINTDGLETRKTTSIGTVKNFTWQSDNLTIAYISSITNKAISTKESDEIYLIDLLNSKNIDLGVCHENLKIEDIKFSPNNKYLGFIGKQYGIDDIYIFNLDDKSLSNITNNEFGVAITSFDFDSDSSNIYFSSNQHDCFDIYRYAINDKTLTQLSNINGDNIHLSFRPKII